MKLLFDEMRKYRSFREVYIGFALAAAWFMLQQYNGGFSNSWFLVFQDVKTLSVCIGIIVVLALPRIFCYERERGTDVSAGTAKHGAVYTFLSKIALIVTVAAISVIIFASVNFICGYVKGEYNGAFEQVMEAPNYARFDQLVHPDGTWEYVFEPGKQPPMTNIGYFLLQFVFLFLASLNFAGFVALIAVITKRTALTVVLSGLSYAVSFYWYVFEYSGVFFEYSDLFDYIYFFGFGGYMFHDSFSWSTGLWTDVWKPVTLCIIGIVIEFAAVWFLWRRRAKK